MKSKTQQITVLILFCLFYVTVLGLKRKVFWDSIPYMASVLALEEENLTVIHDQTYHLLVENATIDTQNKLIKNHVFCKTVFENKESFEQQLPFFKVKFLYILFSYFGYKLGLPLYFSIFFVSIISFLFFFGVILKWLNKHFPFNLTFLLSGTIVLLWFNFNTFRISSPDALAGLFILLGFYYYFEFSKPILSFSFFIAAAFTRPDFNLLLFCMLPFILKNEKKSTKLLLLFSTSLTFATTIFISKVYLYDGWQMFYRSFINLSNFPKYDSGSFSISSYFLGLKNGIIESSSHLSSILFISCFIYVIINWTKLSDKERMVFLAISMFSLFRFIIHPWLEDRFVFLFLDLFLILLVIKNKNDIIFWKNRITKKFLLIKLK